VSDLYRQLADDYHLLFPAREAQLSLLKEAAGPPLARVLDCASGTGEYVAALAGDGYAAQGIELDEEMHERALARHAQLAGRLIAGDMLDARNLASGPFDLAYCIGNSLAHLDGVAEVASAARAMWELTRPAGAVLLQVSNFELALRHGRHGAVEGESHALDQHSPAGFIYDMPMLSATRADGSPVQLLRHYLLRRAADLSEKRRLPERLVFHTILRTADGEQEAFTPLLLLTRDRLSFCLPREAEVKWYGGFDRRPWGEDCPATVALLR
jgi:SAM-dependent methyltransferase